MNPIQTQLINYREKFDSELHNNILSFWMKYGVEKDGHGFYGAIDLDRNPVLSANKTSVLNAPNPLDFCFSSNSVQRTQVCQNCGKSLPCSYRRFC